MCNFNKNEMKTAKDIKDKASMTFAKRNKEFIESEQRKQTINNTVIGFDVLKYNEDYLNECIAKATPRLSKIKDIDKHLDEIRGVEPELTDEEIYQSGDGLCCVTDEDEPEHTRIDVMLWEGFVKGAKWYRDRNKLV
jgi:hypothetical protein